MSRVRARKDRTGHGFCESVPQNWKNGPYLAGSATADYFALGSALTTSLEVGFEAGVVAARGIVGNDCPAKTDRPAFAVCEENSLEGVIYGRSDVVPRVAAVSCADDYAALPDSPPVSRAGEGHVVEIRRNS